MSIATAVLTVGNFPGGIDNTQRRQHVYGTVAIGPTTNTYVTGGLVLTWTGLKDTAGNAVLIDTTAIHPVRCEFFDVTTSGSGYIYTWSKTNDSIQIFVTGSAANDPLNEFAQSDIPSAVHSATITFHAEFLRGQ